MPQPWHPPPSPASSGHRGWNTEAMPVLPVIAVVGATAAGKSELALDLAEHLGGEVVNTDSMQLYRGMDIGTAKLPVAERRGIRHHLVDVLDVREEASVAEFQATGPCGGRGLPCPRRGAGAGRRLRALHAGRARPARLPRHGSRGPAPARARPGRAGVGRPARPVAGTRPRGGRSHREGERTPDRARVGGGRADRGSVRRADAASVVRLPGGRAGRRGHRPGRPRRADHPPGRPDVGRRTGRGGTTRSRRWASGRAGPRAGRWATNRCWRSWPARSTEEESRRPHRGRDPTVRASAGRVVPQGPPGALGADRHRCRRGLAEAYPVGGAAGFRPPRIPRSVAPPPGPLQAKCFRSRTFHRSARGGIASLDYIFVTLLRNPGSIQLPGALGRASPSLRWGRGDLLRQGSRHRERLRARCPTPTAGSSCPASRSRPCATGVPGSAATA